MKVAILLHWNEGEDSGVFKKIVSQMRIWRILGIQTSLHIISRNSNFSAWQRYLSDVPLIFHKYHFLTRFKVWREAADVILTAKPDLVYHRYDLYMPSIKALVKQVPLILEINTNDLKEYCLHLGLRCWYNRFTRRFLLSKAAGLVFVTYELSQLPHFAIFRKPFVVISNGILLQDYPQLPPPNNRFPRLVFIGTGNQPWHGVDKIIKLAQYFPSWTFELIGPSRSEFKGCPSNVRFWGPLTRSEYEPLLAQCDIALGTLALHRKAMQEACPLKVREYLAYGLPVIIGYKDTDFTESAPFILRLPNSEDNIETGLSAIESFVSKWKGKRVPREAIAHLDLEVKESRRVKFFEDVLRRFNK